MTDAWENPLRDRTMAYGFRPNPPGYVSFDELREGFIRWLLAGGDQDEVTIARDERGSHSAEWLLSVLSRSDEVLTKREQMILLDARLHTARPGPTPEKRPGSETSDPGRSRFPDPGLRREETADDRGNQKVSGKSGKSSESSVLPGASAPSSEMIGQSTTTPGTSTVTRPASTAARMSSTSSKRASG